MDRALLIRMGAIGDVVHASSAARFLVNRYPGIEVDLLTSPVAAGLFPVIPGVHRVHVLSSRRIPLRIHPDWARMCRVFARRPYGLAYLMETDPRFLPLLEGVRAERKIALGRDEGPAAEEAASVPVPVRYQRLLAASIPTPAVESPVAPRLVPRNEDRRRALGCLVSLGVNPDAPLLGLHPGNSFRGRKRFRRWVRRADNRSWPEERWADLIVCVHRSQRDIRFVLFGSEQDRPLNRRVAQAVLAAEPDVPLADAAGHTDLPTAAALLERFFLFVSTDTGPLHMAAALGTPLVGLYGPTRYEQTRPYTEHPGAVTLCGTLPCQPCYGTPRQKTCRQNLCMQSIRVKQVLDAVLAATPGSG